MKTKMKFEDIKGMLRREEMKEIIGGNVYGSGPAQPISGTALGGGSNSPYALSVFYSNGGSGYATSYNYGAGINGGSASGYPANTYNNAASTSGTAPNTSSPPYARP